MRVPLPVGQVPKPVPITVSQVALKPKPVIPVASAVPVVCPVDSRLIVAPVRRVDWEQLVSRHSIHPVAPSTSHQTVKSRSPGVLSQAPRAMTFKSIRPAQPPDRSVRLPIRSVSAGLPQLTIPLLLPLAWRTTVGESGRSTLLVTQSTT